jgi:serine/threonine protein kinase
MNAFSSLLSWLCDGYWPGQRDESLLSVRGHSHVYALQRLLAVGDVADIYLGSVESDPMAEVEGAYILKVSSVPEGNVCLDIERKTLAKLLAAAGATTYRKYLPDLIESFLAREIRRHVNVFQSEPGFHTLEQVHEQHPALDGRHLAWIFNRLLTVLGFCHRQGIIHGAVLPCHVMVEAPSHGLRLVGWGQSVVKGRAIRTISTRYRDWYPPEVLRKQPAGPATDLFLAARCLVYLAGGDPVTNWMPDAVPQPMRQFIASCLLESARMRPDDAWALLEDFAELLQRLYGSPQFHELTLT